MQENWLEIIKQFDLNKRYVLAAIVNTQGATYRKAGTLMLVGEDGHCTGLLSGGCLEADIALHASEVFTSQTSKLIHYDLTADADLLWGLGLGCEGVIDILLLPLSEQNQFLGLAQLLASIAKRETGRYWIALNQQTGNYPQAIFTSQNASHAFSEQGKWLSIPITPVTSLAILGAGPDAVPLANIAVQMGWQVCVHDHREKALTNPEFLSDVRRVALKVEQCEVDYFNQFDAAVVMTHNLNIDQCFLANLLDSHIGYIGLLGPLGRRDKLLKQIGVDIASVNGRVFGPVGLNIGGRSPQAIALSILAQVQQQMSLSLREKQLDSAYIYG